MWWLMRRVPAGTTGRFCLGFVFPVMDDIILDALDLFLYINRWQQPASSKGREIPWLDWVWTCASINNVSKWGKKTPKVELKETHWCSSLGPSVTPRQLACFAESQYWPSAMQQGLRSNAIYCINKSQRCKGAKAPVLKQTHKGRCTDYFDSCWCYGKSCESGRRGERGEENSRIMQQGFVSVEANIQMKLAFNRRRMWCFPTSQQWQLPYSALHAEFLSNVISGED